jgi:hypothetical protein
MLDSCAYCTEGRPGVLRIAGGQEGGCGAGIALYCALHRAQQWGRAALHNRSIGGGTCRGGGEARGGRRLAPVVRGEGRGSWVGGWEGSTTSWLPCLNPDCICVETAVLRPY